jgi:hypothetical protein
MTIFSDTYVRMLHKMGYFNYQEGLIFRHLNQEGGWNSHLTRSRNFILKSAGIIKPSVVTVLGSGWLLDFPLKEIAEQGIHINLVDIVHPPEVRRQTSEIKNVTLREEDVTGGLIDEVWTKAKRRSFFNKISSLDDIRITEYNPEYEVGMVISLNILTQLETLPVKLLRKKANVDEVGFLRFRKNIQENHVLFLKRHRSVLISDLSELITGSSGKADEKISVLAEIPESDYKEEWTWDFDLLGSDYYRKKSVFRIMAILINNEA